MADKHRSEIETSQREIAGLKSQLAELREEVSRAKLSSLSSTSRIDIESQLRAECSQLRKQYDELKYAYDEIIDEKSQLSTSFNEMKSRSTNSSLDEANRLNMALNVTNFELINIIFAV